LTVGSYPRPVVGGSVSASVSGRAGTTAASRTSRSPRGSGPPAGSPQAETTSRRRPARPARATRWRMGALLGWPTA